MEKIKTPYGRINKKQKSSVSLPNWLKNNEEED